MSIKVLLVEDEDNIRQFTKINLAREGFEILEAESGEKGVELAELNKPGVAVLDIMLPGIDGFEVCKILRNKFPNIVIIMLTAKTQDNDKIEGLERGADDYLTKPFNPRELILRIKSVLRRSPQKQINSQIIEDETFKLDMYSRTFYKNGKEITLTPTELNIIKLLMQNPGKAITRDELMDKAWGEDFIGDAKIVDVNMRRLRSKIEEDSTHPKYIVTVWGVGYRWENKK
ncbi:DNA-binding response regulator [Finegoldia magna]|uniref:response regulator transcription factor n=1 Tax=Finegoldia magna TaxID=1260 RepID=UPI000B91A375|nr:response regulator transcription factor [Finegoldia magna]OXZ30876.1 DNA-binding response regulator [Finegoldia magna]